MAATAKVRPLARVKPLARPVEPVVRMIPTGCVLLDLQNSGGWALGRMVNIVGDTSTGKTLLAIEACANFARLHGADGVRYCETEAAFDEVYAARMGLPSGIQRTNEVRTVEDFHDDLSDYLAGLTGAAGLYCLDSVDALSSQAEAKREIGDHATYATEKAKVLHEVFRRRVVDIERKRCCLMMISQTKDNIGNTFAPKTRSGGHALDFFSSTTVWLHEVRKEKRTVSGVERVTGIHVRAQNKKNRLGPPFRVVDVLLVFDYGLDDELSCIDWLKHNKADETGLLLPLDKYARAVREAREQRNVEKLADYIVDLRAATRARWQEIETALEPPVRKYEVL